MVTGFTVLPSDSWRCIAATRLLVASFDYLLTTVFPDVRTKDHLEIRMGDSLPYPYSFAYLVFWKGLLYDENKLNQLYEK